MKNLILIFLLFILNTQAWSQNALSFDGTNDRVDCGNNTAVQIAGTQITLEAWVKPTSFGPNVWSNNIIDKESWTPQQGYMLRTGAGGKVNFNLGSYSSWNEVTTTATVLTANVWTHVAATYDGSYMRIYINGICTDSIVKNISFYDASSNNLVVGDNSQNGRKFAGTIDEVRIWNVARTKIQIQAGMNTEFCGGATGLKAYYRFNQGTAGGTNTTITSVINSALVGTNATLSGFALSGSTSNFVAGKSLSPAGGGTTDSIYESICAGTTYLFNGQPLSSAGTYTATFNNAAGCDSVVTLFLSLNSSSSSFVYDTICQGETFIFGSQHLTSTGNYSRTLTAANGCDSVITLSLTVKSVNTGISFFSGGLTAMASGAQYQWINCPSMDTIGLYNQTSASMVAPYNGSFAVIVTQNSCTDTSNCQTVAGVGMQDLQHSEFVIVFPNPSSKGIFNIAWNSSDEVKYTVLDVLGKEIANGKAQINFTIDLSSHEKGIYYLKLNFREYTEIRKLIVQ